MALLLCSVRSTGLGVVPFNVSGYLVAGHRAPLPMRCGKWRLGRFERLGRCAYRVI
jgi:hypothetical protein